MANSKWPLAQGRMADLIREHDWATTALGPIEHWPQSRKIAIELMLSSGHAMQIVWGPEQVMLYNDAYAPMLGQRHPQALGARFCEAWPEIWDDIAPLVDQVYAGETIRFEELPLVMTRRGFPEDTWWSFSYSPLRDESGAVAGLLNVTLEATGRVRAERAERERDEAHARLQHNEARLQALVAASSDVVYSMSPDWKEMRQLTGRGFVADTRVPSIRWLDDYLLAEDRAWVLAAIDKAIAARKVFELEHRVRRADGSIGWTFSRAVPVFGADGEISEWFGMAADITEQRESARRQAFLLKLSDTLRPLDDPRALKQAAAHLLGEYLGVNRVFYAEVDDARVSIPGNYENDIVPLTPGWYESSVYGDWMMDTYRRGEVLNFSDSQHDPRCSPAERAALAELQVIAALGVGLMKGGCLRSILVMQSAVPRLWTAEETTLLNDVAERTWVAIERARAGQELEARVGERTAELQDALDHLNRETAERQLAEERLRQSEKLKAVGQLTGGIAHDFNNMLQGLMSALGLVRTRVTQGRGPEAIDYLDAALKAANRAGALTQRLLAFSRLQTLAPRPVSMDQIARGMEDMIRSTVGPAVQVELELAEGRWQVLCDPGQMESALLNLCINARDAMPDGGWLTISTEERLLQRDDLADFDDLQPGRYAVVAVSDTGTGMRPDVLARAFEPFFTTKPAGQGTGLGLSQIYGFMRQSGGLVQIDTQVDKGTTVRLCLPLLEAADLQPQAPVSNGKTLLLVEDEHEVRALLADQLRDLGYRVLEADTAAAAQRILNTGAHVDLMVTDFGLRGGVTGRQLADAVREKAPGLPVIFITGFAGAEPLLGEDVLRKPFETAALASLIEVRLAAAS
ncbi:PAS domain-containing protein [Pseudomonas sp. 148P]|uniref:histidine kinase n=3 Tax=Pseudomonas TaxID=286 RepID=A0ABU7HZ09_9PSED|nr:MULTISPECIES: PAS domain-containing protein [unclassified Pseudomonas]MEE1925348.1 PAS domain-containing protein [Pseudomonas sp. 147P]MEE1936802.1 PAS domain-containing protein [Pseudomonas sp. 148P]